MFSFFSLLIIWLFVLNSDILITIYVKLFSLYVNKGHWIINFSSKDV